MSSKDRDPSNKGPSDNAFAKDMPGTHARSLAEARIEGLRARGGLFVEAVRATRLPMAMSDPSLPGNPIVFVNDAFLQLSGYSMAEVLGQQPHFMNGADTDPEDAVRFRDALEQDRDEVIETIQYRKDRSRFVASVFLSAFKDADGRTLFQFLSWIDVTARVAAEDELVTRSRLETHLRAREARLRGVLDGMGEGFGLIAPDFTILEYNREALRMDGRPREEIVGRSHWDAFPGSENTDVGRLLKKAMAERVPVSLEHRYAWEEGRALWLDMRAYPTEDGALAVFWRDVTQRKNAETALRESEARFRQFAAAASGVLWIRDAASMKMEYVSPAIAAIYGVAPQALFDGVEAWAAHIVPEDREIALEHLARARAGEAVVHEFRIQRASDKTFRWIRDAAFPLRDDQGRIQRIGGISDDITEAKLAVEHQGVLLAELQHRVRNIMAIIRSITARTADGAASVPDYAERMAGRLQALGRVQALLTRAANARVGLRSIVHDEVSAQADHAGQYVIEGPDIELSPKAAEVLTLAVHELSTNALKYGALSVPGGKVRVTWRSESRDGAPWLVFDWAEEGAHQRAVVKTRRQGFGSELIEGRIPYELKGSGRLAIEPGGARCHLEFPLTDDASILETGAPQPATVFGGALDMSGAPDLTGHRILVVEDDYYLATDLARALRSAGADVLGPVPTEAEARTLLSGSPETVLLDVNLSVGPSFKLAGTLRDKGIPFVFVTGYDQEIIPPEFGDVQRLEKPVQLRRVVDAVAKLLAPS